MTRMEFGNERILESLEYASMTCALQNSTDTTVQLFAFDGGISGIRSQKNLLRIMTQVLFEVQFPA